MMTINKAIGVKYCDIDIKSGEQLTHSEKTRRIIEFLGGLDEVARYIPFPMEIIRERLKSDQNLNNTSLVSWDAASGFRCNMGYYQFIGGGIWELYRKHGINVASCAEGVCILKEAARWLVKREEKAS